MDEGLLKALNPGKVFDKPGTTMVVANIKDERAKEKVGKLVVEKSTRALRARAGRQAPRLLPGLDRQRGEAGAERHA